MIFLAVEGKRRVARVQRGGLVAVHPRVRAPARRRRDGRSRSSAAAFGLGLVALLIAYLPTIYASFSRREVLVAYLTTRAGTPAERGRPAAPRAPHRPAPRPRRPLGEVPPLVRRAGGDAHVPAAAQLLPVAVAGPLVGDRRGHDPRRRVAHQLHRRRGLAPDGGPLRAQRLHRVAFDRRLLRHGVPAGPAARRSDHDLPRRVEAARARAGGGGRPARGRRRPGVARLHRAGASTTTSCW